MLVSSGFQSSPGHAALGNAICIALAHHRGHQNGQLTRCILITSQRPCDGPLKLKLRHSNIYYNVISLLLCFWHLPTMMDAVLATIVASGQANIN
jgi:hypothetical protein